MGELFATFSFRDEREAMIASTPAANDTLNKRTAIACQDLLPFTLKGSAAITSSFR
jgi:hypothetical protein